MFDRKFFDMAFFLNTVFNFWLLWAVVRSLLGCSYRCSHDRPKHNKNIILCKRIWVIYLHIRRGSFIEAKHSVFACLICKYNYSAYYVVKIVSQLRAFNHDSPVKKRIMLCDLTGGVNWGGKMGIFLST